MYWLGTRKEGRNCGSMWEPSERDANRSFEGLVPRYIYLYIIDGISCN